MKWNLKAYSVNSSLLKILFFNYIYSKPFESTIIGPYYQKKLGTLCEFPVYQKWELKYRATKNGFKSADFHSKCDGVANTLTLIKAKSGNIFGGFTEKEWHSDDDFVSDPNAFIFSLVNKKRKPFKALCSNEGKQAIYCDSDLGPCFGFDDICIQSDSNINKESCSNFGHAYQHPDYLKGTAKAKSVLARSRDFQILEIEVLTKSN